MVFYLTDTIPNINGLYVASSSLQAYFLAKQIYGKLDTKSSLDEIQSEGDKKVVCADHINTIDIIEDTVILSDAKWIVDPQRGWSYTAWIETLIKNKTKNVWIVTPRRLRQTFLDILHGKVGSVQMFTKKTKFQFGFWTPKHVSNKTIIYSFSQSEVLYIQSELISLYPDYKVIALHGGMDLVERAIIDLNHNKLIVITTDVYVEEYGIKFDEVVFTNLYKYDGSCHRRLFAEEILRMADVSGSRNLRLWNIQSKVCDIAWLKRIVSFINHNDTYRDTLRAKYLPLLSELNLDNGYVKGLSHWISSFKENEIKEMGILRDMLSWAIDLDKLQMNNLGHLLYSPKREWHFTALNAIINNEELPDNSHIREWICWFNSVPLVNKVEDTMVHNQEVFA
jgi:hypothetical protein